MMTGSSTIGDLALRLYESGRYDAVCDALGTVVRCGGEVQLCDLLTFGLSAHHLGRTDLAQRVETTANGTSIIIA